MKTAVTKPAEVVREWFHIDAEGKTLGRLAARVAGILRGKHRPTFTPNVDMGDHVVIVNAEKIQLTGNKMKTKLYRHHSGYPGGLRERTFEEQLAKDPRRVVEKAVKGMLPSSTLGRELFRHLKVYSGPNHPHAAQVRAGMGAAKRPATSTATSEQSE